MIWFHYFSIRSPVVIKILIITKPSTYLYDGNVSNSTYCKSHIRISEIIRVWWKSFWAVVEKILKNENLFRVCVSNMRRHCGAVISLCLKYIRNFVFYRFVNLARKFRPSQSHRPIFKECFKLSTCRTIMCICVLYGKCVKKSERFY